MLNENEGLNNDLTPHQKRILKLKLAEIVSAQIGGEVKESIDAVIKTNDTIETKYTHVLEIKKKFVEHAKQLIQLSIIEESFPSIIIDSNILLTYIIGKPDINYLATKAFLEIAGGLSPLYITSRTLIECEDVIQKKFKKNILNIHQDIERHAMRGEDFANIGFRFHPVVVSYYNKRVNSNISSENYCKELKDKINNILLEYNIKKIDLEKCNLDKEDLFRNTSYLIKNRDLISRKGQAITHDAVLQTLTVVTKALSKPLVSFSLPKSNKLLNEYFL